MKEFGLASSPTKFGFGGAFINCVISEATASDESTENTIPSVLVEIGNRDNASALLFSLPGLY